MGLAASQGRYLCLTARNSDLIYEAQQISQQRLALAQSTQEVAEKYNEAMSNRMLTAVFLNENGEPTNDQLTYRNLTQAAQAIGGGLGLKLVDLDGSEIIPGDYVKVTTQDGAKDPENNYFYNLSDFISTYMPDLDDEQKASFGTSWDAAIKFYNEQYTGDKTGVVSVSLYSDELAKYNEEHPNNHRHTTTDERCLDKDFLYKMLTSGQWLIQKENTEAKKWDEIVWQGSSRIVEVSDESDDAKAEAEYEEAMAEINAKDKILELRLEQVQTQQSAVEKELESIKQVISKNIEDTFKTFNA